jgi:hypothetical protein
LTGSPRARLGRRWRGHDDLPYSELQFFPKLAAFNIGWHERKLRRITSFAAPPRGRSASAESAH